MNTKHTPGPWIEKATAGGHDFEVYQEQSGRTVAVARERNDAAHIVACVNNCEGINPEAVPDLITTLEDAREWIESGAVDGVYYDAKSVSDSIAAILAKAKGGGNV